MIRSSITAIASAALLGGPVWAQDPGATPPDPVVVAAAAAKARDEALTAQAQARTARIQAEQAEAAARLAVVPKSPATGAVSVADGAGQLEATMLASRALLQAAARIAEHIGGDCAGTLVVGADDAPQFDALIAFKPVADELAEGFTRIATLKARPGQAEARPERESAAAVGAVVQAAIDLLKTDVTIKPLTVTTPAGMVARAVAASCANAVLPGELLFPNISNTTINDTLSSIVQARAKAFASFEGQPNTPTEQARKAWFDALAARHDALTAALQTPDAAGRRPIAQLHRLEVLSKHPKVLKVTVDSAGGTQYVKRNLATLIGFDPLTVTGGTVVSYSLADLSTGAVSNSGLIVCGTGRSQLGAAHGPRAPRPTCRSSNQTKPPGAGQTAASPEAQPAGGVSGSPSRTSESKNSLMIGSARSGGTIM
jgi:hypothetical protein